MSENHGRGGRRPGAGRPSEEELFSKRFRLSAIDIAIAEQLGVGNQTAGVRKALAFAHEHPEQLTAWEKNREGQEP